MSAASKAPPAARVEWWPLVPGLFLAFALLKLGNPVILDHVAPPPATLDEALTDSWPAKWGYVVLAPVALLAALRWRRPAHVPTWAFALPALWLAWQFIAAATTVDSALTGMVLPQFVAATVCFAIGLAAGTSTGARWLRLGLLLGLLGVLVMGFRQQYGGLAASREFFFANEQTGWRERTPEELQQLEASRLIVRKADGTFTINPNLIEKLGKDRIFSTLVSANTFAGVILLLLPGALGTVWWLTEGRANIARGVLLGLVAYMGLACLYWSGSKGGWLCALLVAGAALLNLPGKNSVKLALVLAVGVGGLALFAGKLQRYFADGARSTVSRWSCWQVAARTAVSHPLLGTGPGTFFRIYQREKPPEVETSRLTHNDYLQQAADSGLVGGVAFTGFVAASVLVLGRRTRGDWPLFTVWLGVLGWALQTFVEFGLYVPGVAWPAFALLGWLWGVVPAAIPRAANDAA